MAVANTILDYLIWLLTSTIAAIVSCVLLPKLSAWISSKTENEKLKAAISDITTTVQTTVDQLEQTMVSQYKKQGRWDLDAQKEVLSAAVEEITSNLLDSTTDMLEKNGVDIQKLILRYIESYIESFHSAQTE